MGVEIIIDTVDGPYWDEGAAWFAEVVSESGETLHKTGPRPTHDGAEYAARQWLRGREGNPQAVLTVAGRVSA